MCGNLLKILNEWEVLELVYTVTHSHCDKRLMLIVLIVLELFSLYHL